MKIAGLTTNQPIAAIATSKETSKSNAKSPFASLLNKVSEGTNKSAEVTKGEENAEKVDPLVKEVQLLLAEGEAIPVEKLEELLAQLVEQGLLPQTLDVEMLQADGNLSFMNLLPDDLLAKIEQLFETETPIEEIMFSGEQPLENLIASIIFLNHVSQTQPNAEFNQSILPFLSQVASQLGKIETGMQSLTQPLNDNVVKEMEMFLSKFHARLSGEQAINLETNNSKLDYVKALYQRTIATDELLKNNTQQDSIAKTMIMGVETQTSINKVQQFALFIDQASKPVNQEQFIKDFQNILARGSFQNGANGMKLLIKLYPEQLGSLRIEIIQQQGTLVARMIASSSAAKDLLESQLQGLKSAFANQNIQVEKLEIVNSASLQQQFERSFERDSNGNQGFSRQNDKNEEEQIEKTGTTFEDAFLEELMNTEV